MEGDEIIILVRFNTRISIILQTNGIESYKANYIFSIAEINYQRR